MSTKKRATKKLSRFYPITELCRIAGVERGHHKMPEGVEIHQWGYSPFGWHFLSQSDANKFLQANNHFDTELKESVPQKAFYDGEEVAYILGITRGRVYQLISQGEIPMGKHEVTLVTSAALRKWFGEQAIRDASIDPHHYYFTPEEAAERLGVSPKEMYRLIELGDLPESTAKNVTSKLMISKQELLRYIKRSVKI